MTDRPIIFSAPMVRALLDARKTQTRRLAWHWPKAPNGAEGLMRYEPRPTPWLSVKVGDRLWVREAFGEYPASGERDHLYRASYSDADAPKAGPWRPSIHMPRWASRITLTVTEVRRQPLQNIDGIDALAEGITREEGVAPWRIFLRLWNELHGEGAWQANPEVIALTFTVARRNIDAKEAA